MNERLYYETDITMTSMDMDDLIYFYSYLADYLYADYVLCDQKWDVTASMTTSCHLRLGFANNKIATMVKVKFDGYDWSSVKNITSFEQL